MPSPYLSKSDFKACSDCRTKLFYRKRGAVMRSDKWVSTGEKSARFRKLTLLFFLRVGRHFAALGSALTAARLSPETKN